MKNTLFLGGSFHGHREDVPLAILHGSNKQLDLLWRPHDKPFSIEALAKGLPSLDFEVVSYTPKTVGVGGRRVQVMVYLPIIQVLPETITQRIDELLLAYIDLGQKEMPL